MKGFLKDRIGKAVVPPPLADAMATPGVHERRLRELYGEDAMFLGRKPVFAKPLVIIAFTNRSGSNLLAEYARQAGRVGGGGEFLNADVLENMQAKHGFKRFPGYIRYLHKTQRKTGQSLMLKASWDQLAMLVRLNVPGMFPGVTVLHTLREDVVAQAVSYSIALQTGRWTSLQGASETEPKFEAAGILRSIEAFHQANLFIDLICRAQGFERFVARYEETSKDPEAVSFLLEQAGLAKPGWQPAPPRLEKQRDARNGAFEAQLLEELRRHL